MPAVFEKGDDIREITDESEEELDDHTYDRVIQELSNKVRFSRAFKDALNSFKGELVDVVQTFVDEINEQISKGEDFNQVVSFPKAHLYYLKAYESRKRETPEEEEDKEERRVDVIRSTYGGVHQELDVVENLLGGFAETLMKVYWQTVVPENRARMANMERRVASYRDKMMALEEHLLERSAQLSKCRWDYYLEITLLREQLFRKEAEETFEPLKVFWFEPTEYLDPETARMLNSRIKQIIIRAAQEKEEVLKFADELQQRIQELEKALLRGGITLAKVSPPQAPPPHPLALSEEARSPVARKPVKRETDPLTEVQNALAASHFTTLDYFDALYSMDPEALEDRIEAALENRVKARVAQEVEANQAEMEKVMGVKIKRMERTIEEQWQMIQNFEERLAAVPEAERPPELSFIGGILSKRAPPMPPEQRALVDKKDAEIGRLQIENENLRKQLKALEKSAEEEAEEEAEEAEAAEAEAPPAQVLKGKKKRPEAKKPGQKIATGGRSKGKGKGSTEDLAIRPHRSRTASLQKTSSTDKLLAGLSKSVQVPPTHEKEGEGEERSPVKRAATTGGVEEDTMVKRLRDENTDIRQRVRELQEWIETILKEVPATGDWASSLPTTPLPPPTPQALLRSASRSGSLEKPPAHPTPIDHSSSSTPRGWGAEGARDKGAPPADVADRKKRRGAEEAKKEAEVQEAIDFLDVGRAEESRVGNREVRSFGTQSWVSALHGPVFFAEEPPTAGLAGAVLQELGDFNRSTDASQAAALTDLLAARMPPLGKGDGTTEPRAFHRFLQTGIKRLERLGEIRKLFTGICRREMTQLTDALGLLHASSFVKARPSTRPILASSSLRKETVQEIPDEKLDGLLHQWLEQLDTVITELLREGKKQIQLYVRPLRREESASSDAGERPTIPMKTQTFQLDTSPGSSPSVRQISPTSGERKRRKPRDSETRESGSSAGSSSGASEKQVGFDIAAHRPSLRRSSSAAFQQRPSVGFRRAQTKQFLEERGWLQLDLEEMETSGASEVMRLADRASPVSPSKIWRPDVKQALAEWKVEPRAGSPVTGRPLPTPSSGRPTPSGARPVPGSSALSPAPVTPSTQPGATGAGFFPQPSTPSAVPSPSLEQSASMFRPETGSEPSKSSGFQPSPMLTESKLGASYGTMATLYEEPGGPPMARPTTYGPSETERWLPAYHPSDQMQPRDRTQPIQPAPPPGRRTPDRAYRTDREREYYEDGDRYHPPIAYQPFDTTQPTPPPGRPTPDREHRIARETEYIGGRDMYARLTPLVDAKREMEKWDRERRSRGVQAGHGWLSPLHVMGGLGGVSLPAGLPYDLIMQMAILLQRYQWRDGATAPFVGAVSAPALGGERKVEEQKRRRERAREMKEQGMKSGTEAPVSPSTPSMPVPFHRIVVPSPKTASPAPSSPILPIAGQALLKSSSSLTDIPAAAPPQQEEKSAEERTEILPEMVINVSHRMTKGSETEQARSSSSSIVEESPPRPARPTEEPIERALSFLHPHWWGTAAIEHLGRFMRLAEEQAKFDRSTVDDMQAAMTKAGTREETIPPFPARPLTSSFNQIPRPSRRRGQGASTAEEPKADKTDKRPPRNVRDFRDIEAVYPLPHIGGGIDNTGGVDPWLYLTKVLSHQPTADRPTYPPPSWPVPGDKYEATAGGKAHVGEQLRESLRNFGIPVDDESRLPSRSKLVWKSVQEKPTVKAEDRAVASDEEPNKRPDSEDCRKHITPPPSTPPSPPRPFTRPGGTQPRGGGWTSPPQTAATAPSPSHPLLVSATGQPPKSAPSTQQKRDGRLPPVQDGAAYHPAREATPPMKRKGFQQGAFLGGFDGRMRVRRELQAKAGSPPIVVAALNGNIGADKTDKGPKGKGVD
ncbi:unnamed protein product [Vitrella brassicaformis CCMP3155]|uniref:Uncharacterized protein n=4 Tax=Vitrella brassicaformis TaxID=1169539 RepID=A0A0G4EGV4_VITBC|nr:unnamed protein product [Vitrella brassicaformis CCMP3155]|eukprot:CEL95694.1 unnamed protein product [Vitrella brassicaformis CCMP3155]